jgi:hypothetical protein
MQILEKSDGLTSVYIDKWWEDVEKARKNYATLMKVLNYTSRGEGEVTWDLWWACWYREGVFFQFFGCSLSISPHRCAVFPHTSAGGGANKGPV